VVLTVTVRSRPAPTSPRRTVLAAGALLAGALAAGSGCSFPGFGPDEPDVIPPADTDALRAVAGESLDLAGRYDRAIAQVPDQSAKLTAIRDAHREHAAAISLSLDQSVAPSAAPSPSGSGGAGSGGVLKTLQAAERAAAERAAAACMAVASYYAPLLGTIAAGRASHAEALT
jgi:hypothetical protein